MHAMLGCSTTCPNCRHQFQCCPPAALPPARSSSCCPAARRNTAAAAAFEMPSSRPEADLVRLSDTVKALRLSDFYYEGINHVKSDDLLKDTKVGTFLVRDSTDPRFLFSLGIQTEGGPKSVRLHYVNGYFRLDAQPQLQESMPLFAGVIDLIQYYVERKNRGGSDNNKVVWVDPQGKIASIYLDQPLRKTAKPPQLKHLARLAINKALNPSNHLKLLKLELPTSLTAYLAEYPYSL